MCASHEPPPNVGDSTKAEHHLPTAAGDVCGKLLPAGFERGVELRPVIRDRAVGLDEEHKHVCVANGGQAGVETWSGPDQIGGLAGQLLEQHTELVGVGQRYRRGKIRSLEEAIVVIADPLIVGFEAALQTEQPDKDDPDTEDDAPGAGRCRCVGDDAQGPAKQRVDQVGDDEHRGHDGDGQHPRRRPGEHRRDVGHEAQVPVEVDVSTEERGRRDNRVAPEHQKDAEDGKTGDQASRDPAPPGGQRCEGQQAHPQLDREPARPGDGRRRPDVLERERDVEDEQGDGQSQPLASGLV